MPRLLLSETENCLSQPDTQAFGTAKGDHTQSSHFYDRKTEVQGEELYRGFQNQSNNRNVRRS